MNTDHKKSENVWSKIEADLAADSGLAVVVMDRAQVVSTVNNNSICEVLYRSSEFASHCEQFCGTAFESAVAQGKTVSVRCHANLHFNAVPVNFKENQQLVAIVGRTFLKADEYRESTQRAMDGDWKQFPTTKLFQNLLLSSSESEINKASKRIEKLNEVEKESLFQLANYSGSESATVESIATDPNPPEPAPQEDISALIKEFKQNQKELNKDPRNKNTGKLDEITAWRSLLNSMLEMEYKEAFVLVGEFLAQRHNIANLAWLENRNSVLESILGTGNFAGQHIQISISAADSRFTEVVRNETSLELRERTTGIDSVQQTVNLFPITIGGAVRSALIIGDEISGKNTKRQISRFIKQVANGIEILRLREEIKQQSRITKAVQKLNQTLKQIDREDFWFVLAQNAAELMGAERGSILFYDEETEGFIVKAAVGKRADIIRMEANETLGSRVATDVLRSGRPLIVADSKKAGFKSAPADWDYQTESFISYPIIISGRKIGVLNLTDKIDGSCYDEKDLEILQMLTPQIALALDHTTITRKADEMEQLSITDPLTGLVNRRYLEKRLAEEISRAQRHGDPTAFLMIDVDSFKSYNDEFHHLEGDKALKIVAECLQSTLRGADVAARFGGEEFSILLPQTTIQEALTIAERIRQSVEKAKFPHRQVTISIGVAPCSTDLPNVESLIEAADKALYLAKEKGRNKVEIYRKNGN